MVDIGEKCGSNPHTVQNQKKVDNTIQYIIVLYIKEVKVTRINVVPVEELSDQHLIAEYHELPRVFSRDINTLDAPEDYCLGKGHVKWAASHRIFVGHRYLEIVGEMRYRGFSTAGIIRNIMRYGNLTDYFVCDKDIELNRERVREKYKKKPDWYRWTKREKPNWLV